jgi:hypothetical protein
VGIIEASPLADQVESVRRAPGDFAIRWVNGSVLTIIAGLEGSGHGLRWDAAVIDEAMAPFSERRDQSLRPALLTAGGLGQLLITSNAGTAESVYWARWVEQGRQSVRDGMTKGLYYCEYSCEPEADLLDEASVRACMPAVGELEAIDIEALMHNIAVLEHHERLRAYGNCPTEVTRMVFSKEIWDANCADDAEVGSDPVSYGLDMADGQGFLVAADGNLHAELLLFGCPSAELLAETVQIVTQRDGRLIIDSRGPCSFMEPELRRAGVHALLWDAAEVKRACQWFHEGILSKSFVIERTPEMEAAVKAAKKQGQEFPMGAVGCDLPAYRTRPRAQARRSTQHSLDVQRLKETPHGTKHGRSD